MFIRGIVNKEIYSVMVNGNYTLLPGLHFEGFIILRHLHFI